MATAGTKRAIFLCTQRYGLDENVIRIRHGECRSSLGLRVIEYLQNWGSPLTISLEPGQIGEIWL